MMAALKLLVRCAIMALLLGCSESTNPAGLHNDATTLDSGSLDTGFEDRSADGASERDVGNNDPDAAEFQPLFNGADLNGITSVGLEPNTLLVENGALKCTGTPFGYWYPPGIYRNFILRLEYRFERPTTLPSGADDGYDGNSGYFVYMTPPHKVWPLALEVQGRHFDFGGVYTLPEFVLVSPLDTAALQAAKRPVGDWNQVEIHSNEGQLSVYLNGQLLIESSSTALREGLLGFESEGAEIHWRNISVKRLP